MLRWKQRNTNNRSEGQLIATNGFAVPMMRNTHGARLAEGRRPNADTFGLRSSVSGTSCARCQEHDIFQQRAFTPTSWYSSPTIPMPPTSPPLPGGQHRHAVSCSTPFVSHRERFPCRPGRASGSWPQRRRSGSLRATASGWRPPWSFAPRATPPCPSTTRRQTT